MSSLQKSTSTDEQFPSPLTSPFMTMVAASLPQCCRCRGQLSFPYPHCRKSLPCRQSPGSSSYIRWAAVTFDLNVLTDVARSNQLCACLLVFELVLLRSAGRRLPLRPLWYKFSSRRWKQSRLHQPCNISRQVHPACSGSSRFRIVGERIDCDV